jgi:hypothetical protein
MISWEKIRLSLLILSFFSVIFVLLKVTLMPKKDKNTADLFVFPEAISLTQWQLRSRS